MDDLEDWEHVLQGVADSTELPVDEDAVQREMESLIRDGLVETYAMSRRSGRLAPTKAEPGRVREERTYWFFPTEAGMRFYCDATGAPFPEHRFRRSRRRSR